MISSRSRLVVAASAAAALTGGFFALAGPAQASPSPGTYTDTWTTPGVYDWVVPAGITTVTIEVAGAQGGTSSFQHMPGAKGGYLAGDIAVTPGATLKVHVGGEGGPDTGGANGGGDAVNISCFQYGGGGGGASDVRTSGDTLADRLIVAGGGGGVGAVGVGGAPGVGGGSAPTAGAGGTSPSGGGSSTATGGGAGTSSAGGAGGQATGDSGQTAYPGNPGALGVGGDGSNNNCLGGGGGGGGYYGGGGGGGQNPVWSGGGGGSAYLIPGATLVGNSSGTSTGDGEVRITWSDPPPPTTTTTAAPTTTTTTATAPAPAPAPAPKVVCPDPVPPLRVFNNAFSLAVAKHLIDDCGSTGREVNLAGQAFWVTDPAPSSACPTWRAVRVVATRNSVLIARFLIDDCQFAVRGIKGAIYVVPEGYPA